MARRPSGADAVGSAVERTVITAARPDAEPVFLHFTSQHMPGVVLAYGRPKMVLTAQPGVRVRRLRRRQRSAHRGDRRGI